ncbi:MAG: FG-GAP repeat protein, partial [Hyphomicrobiaceae bacterium]|nr:FG-GAP repeat protein [Hyphomicrobiaceae bacterium]
DSSGDRFGNSVSTAGDVNGDGLDDVIAGADYDDDGGSNSGSAFIFYGGVTSGVATAKADVKLIGDGVSEYFGRSVSSAGDVNGDGKDDVIVGAEDDNDNGADSGSAKIFTFEEKNFQNSVKLSGDTSVDYFGASVSSAGDVNGDGKEDVIVGAYGGDDGGPDSGSAYIFYGGINSGNATVQADVKLIGDDTSDQFGWSVSGAGDVNGDGLDDVIVGAPSDDDGGSGSGSVFIFCGGVTSGNATSKADIKLIGDSTGDEFGASVSSAGDVNGDGKDDVIVGAYRDDDGGDDSGSAFIFYGGQVVSGGATAEAVTNGHGVKITGDDGNDNFGNPVSSAGDMNGDGKDDVIVGAYLDDDNGNTSGSAFIFYGGQVASGSATEEAVTNGHGIKLIGDNISDNFGRSISGAGDMNGDGKDDVIVGAPADDDNGNSSGSAFIFYGGVTSGSATAKADIKLTGDDAGDQFGRFVSGAGDMNGDGCDDVIVGARHDDDNGTDSGSAFIFSLGPSTEMIQIDHGSPVDSIDYFGASVSSAGDVNGDGLDDVIVGAFDDNTFETGAAYIFYGGVTSGTATAKADVKLIGDSSGDRFGHSVSGAGDVNGD